MARKKEFAALILEEKFDGVINQKSMEEKFIINLPKYLLLKKIITNIDETIFFLEEIKKINEGEITTKENNEKNKIDY